MSTRKSDNNETYLELKYCERCGGLWLRERGSGQTYCVPCGRALEEMPPASTRRDTAKVPRGPKWAPEPPDFESLDDGGGFEASLGDAFGFEASRGAA